MSWASQTERGITADRAGGAVPQEKCARNKIRGVESTHGERNNITQNGWGTDIDERKQTGDQAYNYNGVKGYRGSWIDLKWKCVNIMFSKCFGGNNEKYGKAIDAPGRVFDMWVASETNKNQKQEDASQKNG